MRHNPDRAVKTRSFARSPYGWFLVLAGCFFLYARSADRSSRHLHPVFDEVRYLDIARAFAKEGGVVAVARCYLQARCLEDNQHPLYLLLLAPAMRRQPEDFARAKLATLLCSWLLLGLAFQLTRRRWGDLAAQGTTLCLALSPSLAALSQQVLADTLFSALYFGALMTLVLHGERRCGWIAFGALAGLAYLAKGNGYFLFVSGLLYGGCRFGWKFFRRPELYLSLSSFAAVSFPLWWRNWSVWRNPFHSLNNKVVWFDWESQITLLPESAQWSEVGLRWYFQHHTIAQALERLWNGIGKMTLQLMRAMAVGPELLEVRLLTGCALLACALIGLRRRWKSGKRAEVLALSGSSAALFLAFAWGFGTDELPTPLRYLFPLAASLLPMSWWALLEFARPASRLSEKARRRLPLWLGAGLVVLAGLSTPIRRAAASNPLGHWAVPPGWGETSRWIRAHVAPAGMLLPGDSDYSAWDCCADIRKAYPYDRPKDELTRYVRRHGLRHALLDRTLPLAKPAGVYGLEDRWGPVSFLSWPRCFRDGEGRFLIFSEKCP